MMLSSPTLLIKYAMILTFGLLVAGCGFVAMPAEEYSEEEELQIHESLLGGWSLSQSCNWAWGDGCTDHPQDQPSNVLTFLEDGSATYTAWDEDGWPVEYEWTYSIRLEWIGGRPKTVLSISGMGSYSIGGMNHDRLSMSPLAKDGIGYTYHRL